MESSREACWARFKGAADAYLATGDKNPATAFLTRVEAKFGAVVAERQRKELWNWILKRRK
jgi:hypothetical protein